MNSIEREAADDDKKGTQVKIKTGKYLGEQKYSHTKKRERAISDVKVPSKNEE